MQKNPSTSSSPQFPTGESFAHLAIMAGVSNIPFTTSDVSVGHLIHEQPGF